VTLTSAGAANTAGVGGYAINATNAVGTGLGNYAISYVAGTLTVGAKALTITANNTNKIYGSTVTLTFTSAGLTNSDSVSNVTLTSAGATNTAGVGGYVINATNAVGTGLGNYNISYVAGTLTVNAKALTVASGLTADNKVYDGTTTATISSNNVVLSGVLPGDVGNVSLVTNGYAATFNTAAVGNGKTVTVGGLTLAGSATNNYTLTQPTLTANITAGPVQQPTILSLTGAGTSSVVISWSAVSNVTYRVQFNSNLGTTNWFDLTPDVTATGSTASATDNPAGASQRFYRVQIVP
jgi:hypothetical protein